MNQRVASTPISSISSSSVDEVAAPLGHRRARAALDDVDELEHRDLEPVGVGADGGDRGLQPRDVAVVVGAEHVDQAVEAALELVPVVGDVGREVGRLAGRALEHAVLVVARAPSCAATARPRCGRSGPRRRAARARAPTRSARPRRASPRRTSGRSARGSARASRGCPPSAIATPAAASSSGGLAAASGDARPPARRRTRPGSRPRAAPRRARGRGSTGRAACTWPPLSLK